jgi:hypothetical protein
MAPVAPRLVKTLHRRLREAAKSGPARRYRGTAHLHGGAASC